MPDMGIPTLTLPSGEVISALGQGTRGLAGDPSRRDEEIEALRVGIDLGLTVIDTADTYRDGGTEELVAEAIAGRRDSVFLISKVAPSDDRNDTLAACEQSLNRLGTDRIDLYLLHWRDSGPLDETVQAFTSLMTQGLIRHWGVSNFDLPDLVELTSIAGGTAIETNQVPYNLGRRGIEADLLPLCREAGVPVMAYAPFGPDGMLDHPALSLVAARHGATAAQVGLAWLLRQDMLCTIPRASTPDHVRENRGAADLVLTDDDLLELDLAFPPPTGPEPLRIP